MHNFVSGYDVPLGYDKYANPPKPLTEMTIGEVQMFQQQMINNKAPSGAVVFG